MSESNFKIYRIGLSLLTVAIPGIFLVSTFLSVAWPKDMTNTAGDNVTFGAAMFLFSAVWLIGLGVVVYLLFPGFAKAHLGYVPKKIKAPPIITKK